MPSRRRFLRAGAAGALAGLAGCSAVPAPRPMLDLTVSNVRDTAVDLGVRFLRSDVTERSEALVYRKNVEVPPDAGSDDPWTVEDILSDRPYRIEVEDRSTRSSHHYHYQPDCSDDDPYDIGVLVRFNPEGGVAFSQTTCSSDAPFL
ncbi:twin-arginine translocation signal domain-containing protein [Halorubrum xinjiangense]|uniref:twin-arginine translocation signal domain-containing protein n=1 Tax=Halorubrum xinjiangense TaxID=261291 RepID=UPI003C70420D